MITIMFYMHKTQNTVNTHNTIYQVPLNKNVLQRLLPIPDVAVHSYFTGIWIGQLFQILVHLWNVLLVLLNLIKKYFVKSIVLLCARYQGRLVPLSIRSPYGGIIYWKEKVMFIFPNTITRGSVFTYKRSVVLTWVTFANTFWAK